MDALLCYKIQQPGTLLKQKSNKHKVMVKVLYSC